MRTLRVSVQHRDREYRRKDSQDVRAARPGHGRNVCPQSAGEAGEQPREKVFNTSTNPTRNGKFSVPQPWCTS